MYNERIVLVHENPEAETQDDPSKLSKGKEKIKATGWPIQIV